MEVETPEQKMKKRPYETHAGRTVKRRTTPEENEALEKKQVIKTLKHIYPSCRCVVDSPGHA